MNRYGRESSSRFFRDMVRLMRARISRYALIGVGIAVATVLVATVLAAWVEYRAVRLATLIAVQRGNPVLWLIDLLPFVYAMWGQYATTSISYEASSVVLDETDALRLRLTSLEHRALHDALTDLPNRVLLYDRIRSGIEIARREKWRMGVAFIDLDNFKQINDREGHQIGDAALQRFAQIISATIRGSDTVGRWGGDEFVVVYMLTGESAQPGDLPARLARKFDEPLNLASRSVSVRAATGVAVFPDHGTTAERLLEHADVAMYHAKRSGRRCVIYDPALETPMLRR